MVHVSSVQPLCRCCGKPIAKSTKSMSFGFLNRIEAQEQSRLADIFPKSKAEAQKHLNEQIVSVSWHRYSKVYPDTDRERQSGGDFIDRVTVWDGETYIDPFFCKDACAVALAYGCAREGRVFKAYNDALEQQGSVDTRKLLTPRSKLS